MSRQNTPGLGIEYEVHVPAYFALLLYKHDQVENFTLRSNVKDFGNLDDVLVDITLKDGKDQRFAFQLKHKEKTRKNLLPTSFEAKGDFNFEKYCEAFKNVENKNKTCCFILYTNQNFDSRRTDQVGNFKMLQHNASTIENIFDTTTHGKNLYQFEVNQNTIGGQNVSREDFDNFFQRFILYTGQVSSNELSNKILDILEHEEHFLKYINLFRKWHRGEFTNKTLDKQTISIHLLDIFLNPFIIKNYCLASLEDDKLELFESALRKFNVTVINDSKSSFCKQLVECASFSVRNSSKNLHQLLQYFIKKFQINPQELSDDPNNVLLKCMFRLAKDYKMIDRKTQELKDDMKFKILWYFFEAPLIIDFNETSKDTIYKAMQMYIRQDTQIKFIIVGQNFDEQTASHLKVFTKLEDLLEIDSKLYNCVIEACSLSLQGRAPITLKQLLVSCQEMTRVVPPEKVFEMLKATYLIGEDKEVLPPYYIPRTVSTNLFNLEAILQNCLASKDVVIIDFKNSFEKFEPLISEKSISTIDLLQFITDPPSLPRSYMITTNEGCLQEHFEKVFRLVRVRTHYFRIVNENGFMLVMSTENMFRYYDLTFQTLSVKEESINLFFNNPVNILCAQPGMGKSSLVKNLKNNCSCDRWTIMIDLKAYNTFLKEQSNADEILARFMEDQKDDSFSKEINALFYKHGKITLFLDGLDEIETGCADNILNCVNIFTRKGFQVWISSRQNLQQKIEDQFHIFIIEINSLEKEEQENYVRDRLQLQYEKHEIEKVVSNIFTSADIAKAQQILGVPLQLYIITQIFLSDKKYLEGDKDMFILTKMYRLFFEGRFEHSLSKTELKNKHLLLGDLEDQLEKYEIPALQSLLSDEIFKALNLDLRRNRRFLNRIKTHKDPMGIIVKITHEDKAVFEHFTFAEYFACVYLVNNFDKAQILKTTIFSDRYQNLLLILNIMLGEESPLHVAVIYQDISRFTQQGNDKIIALDKGKRNLLHLAACNDRHNMVFDFVSKEGFSLIENFSSIFRYQKSSSGLNIKIVKSLLQSNVDSTQRDTLFKMNPLEYALASGSLYVAELILRTTGINQSIFEMIQVHKSAIACYALRYGYPNLLSTILSVIPSINNIVYFSAFDKTGKVEVYRRSILHFVVMRECANKNEMMNLLVNNNIIAGNIHYGFRIFQFPVVNENIIIIYFLLKKNSVVNYTSKSPSIIREDLDMGVALEISIINNSVLTMTFINDNNEEHFLILTTGQILNLDVRNENGESLLNCSFSPSNVYELNNLLTKESTFNQMSLKEATYGGTIEIKYEIKDETAS